MQLFLLDNEKCWGLFPVKAIYYSYEFTEYFRDVKIIGEGVNIKKYLIEHIGRNQLFKSGFIYPYDIGKVFYK